MYLRILIPFLVLSLCGCRPKGSIRVHVTLDSITGASYDQEMAYLFAENFRHCRLIDSCRISENTIFFKGVLPIGEGSWRGEIVTKNKRWWGLQLTAEKRIDIRLGEALDISSSHGSHDTQAYLDMVAATKKQGVHFRRFRDSLPHVTDPAVRRQIKDSIRYYDLTGPVATRILVDYLHTIEKTGTTAAIYYVILGDSADSATMAETAKYLRAKFPDDEDVQLVVDGRLNEMYYRTHEDSVTENFRRKLLNLRPLGARVRQPTAEAPAGVTAYKQGDEVRDFALPGVDGEPRSLYSLDAPYVLIDFWATWCAPCRKEIPYLIAAKEKYGDALAVYAVSLDYDADAWRQYIDDQMLESFTHVLLDNKNPIKPEIAVRFSCSAIPRNLLLDADRRIIATDLRGEKLEKKLNEVIMKQ